MFLFAQFLLLLCAQHRTVSSAPDGKFDPILPIQFGKVCTTEIVFEIKNMTGIMQLSQSPYHAIPGFFSTFERPVLPPDTWILVTTFDGRYRVLKVDFSNNQSGPQTDLLKCSLVDLPRKWKRNQKCDVPIGCIKADACEKLFEVIVPPYVNHFQTSNADLTSAPPEYTPQASGGKTEKSGNFLSNSDLQPVHETANETNLTSASAATPQYTTQTSSGEAETDANLPTFVPNNSSKSSPTPGSLEYRFQELCDSEKAKLVYSQSNRPKKLHRPPSFLRSPILRQAIWKMLKFITKLKLPFLSVKIIAMGMWASKHPLQWKKMYNPYAKDKYWANQVSMCLDALKSTSDQPDAYSSDTEPLVSGSNVTLNLQESNPKLEPNSMPRLSLQPTDSQFSTPKKNMQSTSFPNNLPAQKAPIQKPKSESYTDGYKCSGFVSGTFTGTIDIDELSMGSLFMPLFTYDNSITTKATLRLSNPTYEKPAVNNIVLFSTFAGVTFHNLKQLDSRGFALKVSGVHHPFSPINHIVV